MRLMLLVAVCLVLAGVAFALTTGTVAADEWCPKC
jgi:hypothetical protein